jgi:murein DD-endopeptidase MepM/ murein hydrolase activator NlpD
MITVLQRQNVNKRTAPPVASRARSQGVRWSNRELPRGPRERGTAAAHGAAGADWGDGYGYGSRIIEAVGRDRALARVSKPPRGRPADTGSTHSFLQRQFVRVKRRHAQRAGEKRWARIIQRAASGSRTRNSAAAKLGREAVAAAAPSRGSRILRNPWLYLALVSLVGLAVAVASLGGVALPLSPAARPLLPTPQDADPALYALSVPDVPDVPGPDTSPVAIATLQVSSYHTQPADTLSRIAARFHLNVDTIVSWNGIRDGRGLAAGTDLVIPNADGLKYVVRRGDTLQGISRSRGVDFNSVLDWNRLASSVIAPGQPLFLPGARMNPNELNRILGNLFQYPVLGRISSYFGERADPFTGVPNYHNGIDIVNRPGTPILAAMAGTVADIGFNYNYGNYVILKHSGQYQTLYGHLTRYVVTRGQKVQQGDKIGELGTTGYSTGPHLHFSIFHNGQPVDPLRFLK